MFHVSSYLFKIFFNQSNIQDSRELVTPQMHVEMYMNVRSYWTAAIIIIKFRKKFYADGALVKLSNIKNATFWNVMPCGSCKIQCFGGTYHLHHQGDKNW
jgi:hypothetical protein